MWAAVVILWGERMKWRGLHLSRREWIAVIVVAFVLAVTAVLWLGAGTAGDRMLCGAVPLLESGERAAL